MNSKYECSFINQTSESDRDIINTILNHHNLVDALLVAVVPTVLQVCLGTALLIMYYKARKLSQQMLGTRRDEENQITMTTIMIVLVLAVCQLPFFFWTIYWNIHGFTTVNDHLTYDELNEFFRVPTVVNSSVNFFIYCLCRNSFRKELYHVLCCGSSVHHDTHLREPRHRPLETNI